MVVRRRNRVHSGWGTLRRRTCDSSGLNFVLHGVHEARSKLTETKSKSLFLGEAKTRTRTFPWVRLEADGYRLTGSHVTSKRVEPNPLRLLASNRSGHAPPREEKYVLVRVTTRSRRRRGFLGRGRKGINFLLDRRLGTGHSRCLREGSEANGFTTVFRTASPSTRFPGSGATLTGSNNLHFGLI
jgi:hypothetical protein